MAEPKKEEQKREFVTEMSGLLLGLLLISVVVERIYAYFIYSKFGQPTPWWESFASFLIDIVWPIWKGIAILVILGGVLFIMRVYSKLSALNKEEVEIYGSSLHVQTNGETLEPKNEKWESIIEKINSANSSDWRLAIVEADIMLEELLRRSGYHGDTLGEMLKSVEKSDFTTLESAWEAHKIRNAIAHRGADFPLNEREAKHAVSLFEEVFKEFKII